MYEEYDHIAEQLASYQVMYIPGQFPTESPPPFVQYSPILQAVPVGQIIPVGQSSFQGPFVNDFQTPPMQPILFTPTSPPPIPFIYPASPRFFPPSPPGFFPSSPPGFFPSSPTGFFPPSPPAFSAPPPTPNFEVQERPEVVGLTVNFCTFCKKNGERMEFYTGHKLRCDNNRLQCPVLRAYVCPICGKTGDDAHTASYCPQKDKDGSVSFTKIVATRCAAGKKTRVNV